MLVGTALVSILLALLGFVAGSGFVYFVIGPAMTVLHWRRGNAQARLAQQRSAGGSS